MQRYPFSGLSQSARVYCFLDLEHPPVAWAVMRGMLVSAEYAYETPRRGFVSFMHAGMIQACNNRRLFNEYLIEGVRQIYFPGKVSRLTGMFFFRSRSEAEARIGDKHWPKYFVADNLVELELLHDEPHTNVDANWITHAPLGADDQIPVDDLAWIKRYWSGEPYNRRPVWERISNGVAIVLDEHLRRRCHSKLLETFPESRIPIVMARLAAEAGTRGGLIAPHLSWLNADRIQLAYCWSDGEFHDPAIIEAMRGHPDFPALHRMVSETEVWKSPDFRPHGRVVQLRGRLLEDAGVPFSDFNDVSA